MGERIGDWTSYTPDVKHPKRDQCATCRHYRSGTDLPTCDAFPEGIPAGVLDGRISHKRHIPGDRGIKWEPKNEDITQ